MDAVRKAIRDGIRAKGESDRSLSLKIGKGEGYIHDFLTGRAKTMPLDIKVAVAKELGMPASKLAANAHEAQVLSPYDGINLHAFQEDAEAYSPGPASILTHLARQPNTMLVRVKTNVLECHPMRIRPGHVLAFDISQAAVDGIDQVDPEKAIVVCQLYDRADMTKAETILLRQYIRPGLLITNRKTGNEAYSLRDAALPFEPRIKGVFRSLHWEA
jgi:hypothetical protein